MPTVPVALLTERCLCCPHVVTALRMESVFAAMKDHVDYVNTHLDRAVDPHFEELRLDRLIAH